MGNGNRAHAANPPTCSQLPRSI